ncbi:hypothetical protein L1049_019266 [Liquidambar formosana]|uniref:S-protein homolog n=1 Tax=Liquidambar formosana TaxID=63359 RepID=A0AAP0S5D8_LIQFO
MDTLKHNTGGLMLVLTVLFFSGQVLQVSGLFDKVKVIIANELERPLTLHCKSKDDDLGRHVLQHWKEYSWAFRVNFWQTTLFWCNFQWHLQRNILVEGSFKIYEARKDQERCQKSCIWILRQEGLYLKDTNRHGWFKIYRWPLPESITT